VAWMLVPLFITPSVANASTLDAQIDLQRAQRFCSAPSIARRSTRLANEDLTSVGITYFAGRSRGGDDAHLAAALTKELANQLLSARIKADGPTVRTRGGNRLLTVKLSDGGGFADVALSLTGAVFREGEQLRTSVKLTRTEDGAILWSGTKVRPIQDLPILARLVAQEVAVRIGAQLTAQSPRPAEQKSAEIYELILQGLYSRSRYHPESLVEAKHHHHKALELDPTPRLAR
jgi:TolB-like protein